jgi:hypothetical protein
MSLPDVKSSFTPLSGGLDVQTPAIALAPGKLIDVQNYEPDIVGGYKRIDGYERFDGHASPSAATYSTLPATITGTIVAGNVITGATSGAIATVLAVAGSTIVIGAITGTFASGENLTISGSTVAATTAIASYRGDPSPSNDADYMLLAANLQRNNISAVPGSGPVRGVWVYKDTVYAFRDNAGGTAGLMYKATSSGWTQIAFGTEIQFTNATVQISVGTTITGGTSGATATVTNALLRTGTWTSAGAGTLLITVLSGTFVSGEALKVGGTSYATSSSAATAITRQPGGQMEFTTGNFTGSTNTSKMYGVDGVNYCFEFDGTTYIPIRTGMTSDNPTHVIFHKTYLFLSFLGSVQFSALGNPYAWTVVLGAGEIATGDPVTGFLPQGGSGSTGSALGIFTQGRTYVLYGTSSANFTMVTSIYDLGYKAFTCQQVSNDAWGMTGRGIQKLITTLSYGDFDYASVSHPIAPIMASKAGLEIASTTIKSKNQYRLFWSDGYCMVAGITGDDPTGLTLLYYQNPVNCYVTATLSNGQEVSYFGSTNGYVYRDQVGTSQDGNTIESWIRLAFNNVKSPQQIKRFRRAVFDVKTSGYCRVNMTYDLGYSGPDARASGIRPDTLLTGGGDYWDHTTMIFDSSFTWDAAVVTTVSASLEGSSKNIGFLFYSNRAQDLTHTVQGITLNYSMRRMGRMDS